MDSELAERLNALNDQNAILQLIEERYLGLEAEKKVLLAKLTSKAIGKSFSERENNALASDDWSNFAKGLADIESQYLAAKRRFEILDKAFYAELNTYKREAALIPKHAIET